MTTAQTWNDLQRRILSAPAGVVSKAALYREVERIIDDTWSGPNGDTSVAGAAAWVMAGVPIDAAAEEAAAAKAAEIDEARRKESDTRWAAINAAYVATLGISFQAAADEARRIFGSDMLGRMPKEPTNPMRLSDGYSTRTVRWDDGKAVVVAAEHHVDEDKYRAWGVR
jgi:hypothetical protein